MSVDKRFVVQSKWTEADIATLLALRSEGKTYTQIGLILNRTRMSALKKAQLLGLRSRQRRGDFERRMDYRSSAYKGPTDQSEEKAFIAECEASYLRYLRAVVKANDGFSWGGHLTNLNASGSGR